MNMVEWRIKLPEGITPEKCVQCGTGAGVVCVSEHCQLKYAMAAAVPSVAPAGQGMVDGKTQCERLAKVLQDMRPHSTFELVRKVYGMNTATIARLASRINDLRNDGWLIVSVKSKRNPNKWWYCAYYKPDILGTRATWDSCDLRLSAVADCNREDEARGDYE